MSSAAIESFFEREIRPLRGERLLRVLHRGLPLGRKYHPLVSLLNSRHGLISIPFGRHRLVQPAAWRKQIANILLCGESVVPEFKLLASLIRELRDGVVLDVGANIGLYTLLLRSVTDRTIFAYEPQPFLFKLLGWNLSLNRISNVEARNTACGFEKSEIAFNIGINGAVATEGGISNTDAAQPANGPSRDWETEADLTQAAQSVIPVPVVTLDEELAEQVSVALLKVDCEGFEHFILRGALETLKRHKPLLFLEIHPVFLKDFGSETRNVVELLSPMYDLEFWTFQDRWPKSKLGRSIEKFRQPRARRYRDVAEVYECEKKGQSPSQIYCIGRPKA